MDILNELEHSNHIFEISIVVDGEYVTRKSKLKQCLACKTIYEREKLHDCKPTYVCGECNVVSTSFCNLVSHLVGTKHMKKNRAAFCSCGTYGKHSTLFHDVMISKKCGCGIEFMNTDDLIKHLLRCEFLHELDKMYIGSGIP